MHCGVEESVENFICGCQKYTKEREIMKSELRKMGMDEIKLKNIVTRGLESLFLYLKRTELIVASGLLSWGHFISSTIIDLIAQIL